MRTRTEDRLKVCIKAAYEIANDPFVCDPQLKKLLEQRIIRWGNLLRNDLAHGVIIKPGEALD